MLSSSLSPKNMNWYCILASFLTRNYSELILYSRIIVDVNQQAIISFLVKTLEKLLAGNVPSTDFDEWYLVMNQPIIQTFLRNVSQNQAINTFWIGILLEEPPNIVKFCWKILPDAVNLCFHNLAFPTRPIPFLLYDAFFQIYIKCAGFFIRRIFIRKSASKTSKP